jgi:hypothetical protein
MYHTEFLPDTPTPRSDRFAGLLVAMPQLSEMFAEMVKMEQELRATSAKLEDAQILLKMTKAQWQSLELKACTALWLCEKFNYEQTIEILKRKLNEHA